MKHCIFKSTGIEVLAIKVEEFNWHHLSQDMHYNVLFCLRTSIVVEELLFSSCLRKKLSHIKRFHFNVRRSEWRRLVLGLIHVISNISKKYLFFILYSISFSNSKSHKQLKLHYGAVYPRTVSKRHRVVNFSFPLNIFQQSSRVI